MRVGRQGRSAIRVQVVLLCAALALSVGTAPAAAGGGNSANAKLCQSGWQSWLRADGTPFANQGACVSYTAQGGILTTFTTSTTSHTTFTRVDLPTIQAYLTRVTSATDDGVATYDQTFQSPPDSDEVNAAFVSAQQELHQALDVESTTPPNHGGGTIEISPPALCGKFANVRDRFCWQPARPHPDDHDDNNNHGTRNHIHRSRSEPGLFRSCRHSERQHRHPHRVIRQPALPDDRHNLLLVFSDRNVDPQLIPRCPSRSTPEVARPGFPGLAHAC